MNNKKITRDRKVRKGVDYDKMAKIWTVLVQAGDWIHIAEISRRTKINESTVRFYLDNYFRNAVQEERIVPNIKLRLVKLKPDADFQKIVKAIEVLKKIKGSI